MTYAHPEAINVRIINDFCNMEVIERWDLNQNDENEDQDSFENLLDVCRSLVLIDVDAETNDDVITK